MSFRNASLDGDWRWEKALINKGETSWDLKGFQSCKTPSHLDSPLPTVRLCAHGSPTSAVTLAHGTGPAGTGDLSLLETEIPLPLLSEAEGGQQLMEGGEGLVGGKPVSLKNSCSAHPLYTILSMAQSLWE